MRRRDQMYRWLREHPLVVDSVLAVLLFLFFWILRSPVFLDLSSPWSIAADRTMLSWRVAGQVNPELENVGTPLVTAGLLLPLALRRVRPEWCGVMVFGTGLGQWLLGLPVGASQVGVLIALHGLAAYGQRSAGRIGLVVALLAAPMAAARYVPYFEPAVVLTVVIASLVLTAWALGDLRRARREQLENLRDHARRLEVEREQESRLAAADERARIAREMHDVVAHSLSVVIAQADGGRYAADGDPKAAVRACETISQTGRSALTEMRRLLGVLRTEDGSNRAPTPDLSDVDELIDGVRDSGLPVEYVAMGTAKPLPSGVELAVYRIIQEALTNVLKHAGPGASASVRLDWTPAGLMISVTDDGRGAAADNSLRPEAAGPGHGIPGMTERAELYGGRLQAGPVPGGGFSVRANLPYLAMETTHR